MTYKTLLLLSILSLTPHTPAMASYPPAGFGSSTDVSLQDQYTKIISLYFHDHSENTTNLSAPASTGDVTLLLAEDIGITAGDSLLDISEGTDLFQAHILSYTATSVTLKTPIDRDYTTAAVVRVGPNNMAVNGATTPRYFSIGPPAGARVMWDITGVKCVMFDATAMDDGTFGGIGELIKGVTLRQGDGDYSVIYSARNNGELALRSTQTEYVDKPPAGTGYGYRYSLQLGGQNAVGVVARLDGEKSERIEMVIQDDLSGLVEYECVAYGHEVLP